MTGDFQPLMREARRVRSCSFGAAFVLFLDVDDEEGPVLVDEVDYDI